MLQADPSWWRCPPEGNQGLPKKGGMWRYRLNSGSYPRNAACQMSRRCFAKCPCRAHRWGICQRAEKQSMVLASCHLPRSSLGLAWHQSSSGSMPPENAVHGSTSQTHAAFNSTLPHGQVQYFMPNTYLGLDRALREQLVRIKKTYAIVDSNLPLYESRFGEMNT